MPMPRIKLVSAPIISSTTGVSPARFTRILVMDPVMPVACRAPTTKPTAASRPPNSASRAPVENRYCLNRSQFRRYFLLTWLIASNTTVA